MSNTIVRASYVQIGQLIPWHVARLQNGQRLRLRELLVVDNRSPWMTQGDRLPMLDAECWALTHYLMFGENGVHRPQLDRFLQLLGERREPQAAFEQAFGDLDALERGFNFYFTQRLFGFVQMN